ncbi:Cytochrome c, mono-and diheme variants [Chryseolinea serpens]|uniref:Cytochrome c, mono-and diheme variants n=1 Tax=Chryseolinea serpens TaxID=947013 RepID=A0A1M5VEV5_9BACT|nr:cytochrome c [Chryseolinea serpens]SHH73453.1 Cytochrome c, mono-and diheme variants [Chryseolinea serpens]
MRIVSTLFVAFSAAVVLTSCGAGGDNQGTEYAPNMYHSVAYEPYSQITDEDAGRWLTSIDYPDGHAEFYNSNKFNPYRMNMRESAPHTVARNKHGWLPYRLGKDSLAFAAANVKSPLDSTAAIIADGKVLYETYCDHCHGPKGKGDGKVAAGGIKVEVNGEQKERSIYAGVANLTSDALKGVSEGHIFHVITMGKGLMWSHGSQISPEDRWKIAKYVKTLQK